MGNFSRDSFDPGKGYTGVRLQQGVPLVDADWNELNDVIRQEIYDTIAYLYWEQDVVLHRQDALQVTPHPDENDFHVEQGCCVVGGRVVFVPPIPYNSQRWRDPVVAKAEGVEVIPSLTTPTSDRRDVVYLDIWDREIGSDQDPDIINPVIGIETSVRLKLEVAVRVAENRPWPPKPVPKGHRYLTLAELHRQANQPIITSEQIDDERRLFIYSSPGIQSFSIPPTLIPSGSLTPFQNFPGHAHKPADMDATGLVPVTLPHIVNGQWSVDIWGKTSGSATVRIEVFRSPEDSPQAELLDSQELQGEFSYWRPPMRLFDTLRYSYTLGFSATGTGEVDIMGIQITYSV